MNSDGRALLFFCKIKNCEKNLLKPNYFYGKVSNTLN